MTVKYALMFLDYLEILLSFILRVTPKWILVQRRRLESWSVIEDLVSGKSLALLGAKDAKEMCTVLGLPFEEHLVRTEDDYLLMVHRIQPKAGVTNAPIVYLQHGLLMCSDIWFCTVEEEDNLLVALHRERYDVWVGNNRGNKYSTTHMKYTPLDYKFWDFSLDEFAFYDVPNTVDYILNHTGADKLSCIGFSQGSAQILAAMSLRKTLRDRIDQIVAIAPAVSPVGVSNWLLDWVVRTSPSLLYMVFGSRILFPSVAFLQRKLPISWFTWLIDQSIHTLFDWDSRNIPMSQRHVAYSKLYSPTSVKSVVHWFQILDAQRFQLFREPDSILNSVYRPYATAPFTTALIDSKLLLVYGTSDVLINMAVIPSAFPKAKLNVMGVQDYEHLDLIWGKDLKNLVNEPILRFLQPKVFAEPSSIPNGITVDLTNTTNLTL